MLTISYNTQSVSIQIWRSCIPQYVLYRYNSCSLSAIILSPDMTLLVFLNMYCTDTTQSWTQCFSIGLSYQYQSGYNFISILKYLSYKIQLNLERKVPQWYVYIFQGTTWANTLFLYLRQTNYIFFVLNNERNWLQLQTILTCSV